LFQQVCYGGDRQLKPCPVVPAPVHERKMAVNQVTGQFQNRLLGGKLDHGLNASVQNSLAVLLITRITQPKRMGRNLPHDESPNCHAVLADVVSGPSMACQPRGGDELRASIGMVLEYPPWRIMPD